MSNPSADNEDEVEVAASATDVGAGADEVSLEVASSVSKSSDDDLTCVADGDRDGSGFSISNEPTEVRAGTEVDVPSTFSCESSFCTASSSFRIFAVKFRTSSSNGATRDCFLMMSMLSFIAVLATELSSATFPSSTSIPPTLHVMRWIYRKTESRSRFLRFFCRSSNRFHDGNSAGKFSSIAKTQSPTLFFSSKAVTSAL
mmetsp:Transcript_32336/g.44175  ORF Transcript_32336/g.44175 Transcript_32336/m.44175 type:complete len:201 (+) Transcript_32336:345-947(+)